MDNGELKAKDAPSLENVHEVKLETLLKDLVNREGKIKTARTLGVNYKTVARSLKNGRLSVHLREALMTRLLDQEQGDAGNDESEQAGAPDQQVEALGEEMLDDMEELRETVEGLRAGYTRQLGELEKRLAEAEAGLGGRAASQSDGTDPQPRGEGVPREAGGDRGPSRRVSSHQAYRTTHASVITMEPQPGDEKVFGDAWPLVDEWRQLRESHPPEGKGVAWLADEERLRELEIALVGEHELTMPPGTDPWDSLSRRTQVRWRTQTLERVHRERVWAQVRRRIRRKLTFGLWRD